VTHAAVSSAGYLIFKFLDGAYAGQTLNALRVELNNGPETFTMALCFGGWNQPAPDSMSAALNGVGGDHVHVLSTCNAWKSKVCQFQPADAQTVLARYRAPQKPLLLGAPKKPVAAPAPAVMRRNADPVDPCNVFSSCTECLAEHFGDIECGWCMGGTINYNGSASSFRCGGFQQGVAPKFTCPFDFRTEDCTGWNCNYTAAQPTCTQTEDGSFSTQDQCEQTCQPAQFAKCNIQTKQCESCQQGPDCQTTKVFFLLRMREKKKRRLILGC
jgi:hypothetical protein